MYRQGDTPRNLTNVQAKDTPGNLTNIQVRGYTEESDYGTGKATRRNLTNVQAKDTPGI